MVRLAPRGTPSTALAAVLMVAIMMTGCAAPSTGEQFLFGVGEAPEGLHHCIPSAEMVNPGRMPNWNPGEFNARMLQDTTLFFGTQHPPERAWAEAFSVVPDTECVWDADSTWVSWLQVFQWETIEAREPAAERAKNYCHAADIMESGRFIVFFIQTPADPDGNHTRQVRDEFLARHGGFRATCPAPAIG